ncbi:unnamed protein product [Lepeophtheirus salmonis]|uniref:(salmon louse) hypothetical protein n=1 Tax=Lepeophtheirus salmonis TaxID=72036 RepID=A0A7R8CM05_LEPSM|nr:unnamed protein product [Lepeophtheirus salmonis]CAF2862164.1 unnamed protein product [Lepeophtheirus salmonis]
MGKISGNRDISPGSEADRYSGRDQRLSPRLSPRFPIPEAPTDLKLGMMISMRLRIYPCQKTSSSSQQHENSSNVNNNNNSIPVKEKNPTPSPPSIQTNDPLKQEYSPSPPDASNVMDSSAAAPPPQKTIKTEMDTSFPHPLYFPPQFHSALYHRQIYSELQQGNHQILNRGSPVQTNGG